MFVGAINQDLRRVIASIAGQWPSLPVYIGCSGSFTIERLLSEMGRTTDLHSNDVSLFSCALGALLSGSSLLVEIKDPALSFLAPTLTDQTNQVATLLLCSTMLEHWQRREPYHRRMWAAYHSRFATLHAETVTRVKAAQQAGIESVLVMYYAEAVPEEERIAKQLSHNAIVGEDDPAVLKALWGKIGDVGLKYYSGLDDKKLKAMAEVGLKALSEMRLDYKAVTFLFLPEEAEDLKRLFEFAVKNQVAKEIHLAAAEAFDRLIRTLDKAKASYGVYNSAVAMTILLTLCARHIEELSEGWFDPGTDEVLHRQRVPLDTVLGTDKVPAEMAARLKKLIDRAVSQQRLDSKEKWRILEHLMESYGSH